LKKCIYDLEKKQHDLKRSSRDLESLQQAPLLETSSTDAVFIPLLDRELAKICAFYESQTREVMGDIDELEELVKEQEEAGLGGERVYTDDEDDEDEEEGDVYYGESPTSPFGTLPQRRRRKSSSAARRSRQFSRTFEWGLSFVFSLISLLQTEAVILRRKVPLATVTAYRQMIATQTWRPPCQRVIFGQQKRTMPGTRDYFSNGRSPTFTYPSSLLKLMSRSITLGFGKF
jgi:hypothetical protein